MNANTQTQAQKFATVYAANLAKRQLFTIKAISIVTKLITAGVGIVSYRHQMSTLLDWQAPAEVAYVVPALVDLLTIACVLAISTPALKAKGRHVASRVIVFPILVSAAINVAGHGSLGVKLVCLSLPIFIPLGELVGAAIEPDFAEMDRIERAAYAVATPEPTVDPAEEARKQALADAAAATKALEDAAEAQRQAALAAEAQRRSEIAAKAAATRRENKAKADAEAEAKRAARRERAALRRLEEAAPVSPTGPATVLSANDKAVLAEYMTAR